MMPMPGGGGGQQGVFVINKNAKRDQGRKAQLTNIQAGKTVAGIVRTTLGPRAMLKMLLDPMGGIVMTNDGNAILREVDVSHPAAKNMIELSRAQDEEVGDGTTSVIILAGELLGVAEPLLEKKLHPTLIVSGYMKALEDAQTLLKELAYPVDVDDPKALGEIVRGSIDTKFASRFGTLISDLAIQAVKTVCIVKPDGRKEIDVKRFAKVEKIQGGELSDCKVLDGVMFNKDITHPRMRREIKNPRVVLLDCPLEYKKGESQTNVEITKESDWEKLLQQEEEEMRRVCDDILKVKPDLVITEKGVSDLAQHFLMKGGCSVIRRIRKTDNHRIARVTGAHICNRTEELQETMVGTRCGRFKVQKIGEEYFTFLTECQDPKACSILLRGATRDVLNEIERNLHDAFGVARNILLEPLLLPGGGAVEMELAARLKEKSKSIEGSRQYAYRAVGEALEVIPRSLAHNCGADVVRAMTDLRARHAASGNAHFGIDGKTGKVADMKALGIFDTFAVKQQTLSYYTNQAKLHQLHEKMTSNKYVVSSSVNSWYEEYINWASASKPAEYFDQGIVNNETLFYLWLNDFLRGPGIVYRKDVRMTNGSSGSPQQITAARMSLRHKDLDSTQTEVKAMEDLRVKIKEVFNDEDMAFAYSQFYLGWETNKVITEELFRNMGLALLAVFLVTLIVLANLWTCLMVFTCVGFTLVNITGTMYFWGLSVETVITIILVLAVGLSVDYASHVGHTFMVVTGTRYERARATIRDIGPAVWNGGFSTFLAVVLLAFSNSYVFKTFFKVFFCVVSYGLFHGLCYLPVILSSIGPPPYDSAQSHEHKPGRLSPVHPVGPVGIPGDNVSYEMAITNGKKTPVRNGKNSSGNGTQNGGYPIPPPDYEEVDVKSLTSNAALNQGYRSSVAGNLDKA